MIHRHGPQVWNNVHRTETAHVRQLIDVDNAPANGPQPRGFALLRQAAEELNTVVQQARQAGQTVRALGSGWALTDLAITEGWLVNTKPLNGCFDISDRYFESNYPGELRPNLIVAQCGISVGELNIHLEITAPSGFRRALKTSGIGAGQSIAGAISGNTHGSAVNFGAMPDFIVGVHLVTGSGRSLWIERESEPVLNDLFAAGLDADLVRNDDVFESTIVSLGAFGIIAAVAIETSPIYQLEFPPVRDIAHQALKEKLDSFDASEPDGLYHYEFVFNPYSRSRTAMEALATKVAFEPGHPGPDPVWIARSDKGFHPGDQSPPVFLNLPFVGPGTKASIQFRQYRKLAILSDTRGTPGQVFTATITYMEGYTESAIAVSIADAAKMFDVSCATIKDLRLPAMSQVRVVHPTRALLGFTRLSPKTAVFEFGLVNDATFRRFENTLLDRLEQEGVPYTLHWSKNSGIDPERLDAMYGSSSIRRWKAARKRVFADDPSLMAVFDNEHLKRCGLA